MKLEQIFYGRGSKGYAVLGSSIPQGAISQAVVDLCGQLGTPAFESDKDDAPFLAQKHFGELVLMVCGCAGTPDALGRGTLFFHALIGFAAEARNCHVTALSLWQNHRFVQTLPGGSILPIEINQIAASSGKGDVPSLQKPAAVKCKRSENLEVVARLGEEIFSGDWVSFSWNPLPGFSYIGLDVARPTSSIPTTYSVYDNRFTLLRSASAQTSTHVKTECPHQSKETRVGSRQPVLRVLVGLALFASGFFVRGFLIAPSGSDVPTIPRTAEQTGERPLPTFDSCNVITIEELETILGAVVPKDGMDEEWKRCETKIRKYVEFINQKILVPSQRR